MLRGRGKMLRGDVDELREELIASWMSHNPEFAEEERKYVRDYSDEDVYRLADEEGIDIFEPEPKGGKKKGDRLL